MHDLTRQFDTGLRLQQEMMLRCTRPLVTRASALVDQMLSQRSCGLAGVTRLTNDLRAYKPQFPDPFKDLRATRLSTAGLDSGASERSLTAASAFHERLTGLTKLATTTKWDGLADSVASSTNTVSNLLSELSKTPELLAPRWSDGLTELPSLPAAMSLGKSIAELSKMPKLPALRWSSGLADLPTLPAATSFGDSITQLVDLPVVGVPFVGWKDLLDDTRLQLDGLFETLVQPTKSLNAALEKALVPRADWVGLAWRFRELGLPARRFEPSAVARYLSRAPVTERRRLAQEGREVLADPRRRRGLVTWLLHAAAVLQFLLNVAAFFGVDFYSLVGREHQKPAIDLRQSSIFSPSQRLWVCSPRADVFAEPEEGSIVVGALFEGSTVTVLKVQPGWVYVQYEREGITVRNWIEAHHLKSLE